jgi:hypothetical protein
LRRVRVAIVTLAAFARFVRECHCETGVQVNVCDVRAAPPTFTQLRLRPPQLRSGILAVVPPCGALIDATPLARAQCTSSPTNDGIAACAEGPITGVKAPTCDVSGRHGAAPRSTLELVSRNVSRGRQFHRLKAGALSLALCAFGTGAQAQDAMWSASPGNNSWNTASNWVPAVVPTGTAIFGASNTRSILFPPFTVTSIGTLQFNPGAPAYTFTTSAPLFTPIRITGLGIVNDSSNPPTFIVGNAADLIFLNASTAGNAIIITNGGGSLHLRTAPPFQHW